MSFEVLFLVGLLVAAVVCFVRELLPVEVTALALLSALVVSGILTVEEALSGLSNEAVVTVAAMFVLSHALSKTGLLEVAAERLGQGVGGRPWLAVGTLLAAAGLISGFLNNTAVVAIFIPLAIDLSRRLGLPPGRVLMPLSYAAIFGGTMTLIGTSTNLLVGSLSARAGAGPIGMFELAPLGLVFFGIGLAYVLLLGPRILAARSDLDPLTGKYQMASYLTEVRVEEGSRLIGKTVRDVDLSRRFDVTVVAVLRAETKYSIDLRVLALAPGDVLMVRAPMESLLKMRKELGVALLTDTKLGDTELSEGGQTLVEALVPPNSPVIGSTLKDLDFRRRYGAFALAIRHRGTTLHTRLALTPLSFADTLLLVTSRERLPDLRRHEDLVVLSELELSLGRHRFWWLVLVLLPLAMALAAFGILPIAGGALAACVVLMVVGALTPGETYRSISWPVVFFIAAFVPLGTAMLETGAAELLGRAFLVPVAWFPADAAPWIALSLVYLATSLMTETVTNNATAILVTPIAIGIAHQLQVDPRPFVFAVCFAASASFMTPTGYQTNMMVYGAGGYRFVDFVRFGAPLNLLFWIVASLLIPRFWPFA